MFKLKKLFSPKLIIFYIILLNLTLGISYYLFIKRNEAVMYSPIGETIQVINSLFHNPPNKTVYGYLPYWVLDNAKYLEYDKLTDISYFALKVDKTGNFVKLENGGGEPGYTAWNSGDKIKNVITAAKIWKVRFALTLVGASDDDIDGFLACDACQKLLIENTIKELVKKDVKDVNLDFEFTSETDTVTRSKYTAFAKLMNEELDKRFGDSKVVVASFADSYKRVRITDPKNLATVVDGIFVMAYDFHQPTSDRAGPVAPIGGSPNKFDLDIKTILAQYKSDVSPFKIILGVPYYGYNFLIADTNPLSLRVPGNDEAGYSIPQYYAMIKDSSDIPLNLRQWDADSQTPYIVYKSPLTGSQRALHYEDAESLKAKYEFAKKENLMGVGIWALGYDGDYKDLWNVLGSEFKN